MNESNNNHENANGTKPVLAPVFDAMEYAYDHWGETLNYMSDDEIEQVKNVMITYGDYDIVVEAQTDDAAKMDDVITSKVRKLEKIRSTITLRVTI